VIITVIAVYLLIGYVVTAVLFVRAEQRNHLPEGAAFVALPLLVAFWPVALAYLAIQALSRPKSRGGYGR